MNADSRNDPHDFLAHAASVRALARALVGDSGADDVEQAAWARALSAKSFVPTGTAGWLATIVRNVVRSNWRAETRRAARETQATQTRREIPTPDAILEREELRRRLVERVLALDDPWRTALVLHYLEERDLRRVAEATGVSIETARTRVKRGLELLRAQWKRESGGTWAVALVRVFDLDRGALAAPTTLGGLVAMSAALKFGIVAAVGIVVVATIMRLGGGTPGAPLVGEVAAVEEPAKVDVAGDVARAGDVSREETLVSAPPLADDDGASNAASVRVRIRWGADSTPAENVWVELRSMADPNPQLQLRRQRTDAKGEVLFEDVAPGRVVARTDRGPSGVDAVAAHEAKLIELVLFAGLRLVGEVVDEREQPVADAEIWIDGTGPTGFGFPLAVSDSEGRFEVRNLDRGSWFYVGARAAGRAPTAQHILRAPAVEEARVRLQFTAPGGGFSVNVVDADGAPVPGAVVRIGEPIGRDAGAVADATHAAPAPPLIARTDERGAVRFEGAKLGPQSLTVQCVGYAPWKELIEVGVDRARTIVLQRGAVLRGRVVDIDGRPLNNARVSIGGFGDAAEVFASTDRDGAYELVGAPVGEFTAIASAPNVGRAEQTFVATPGEELEWNARIEPLGVIVGRVVAPGMSTEGWMVEWAVEGERRRDASRWAKVGGDGAFRVTGCEDLSGMLRVRAALDAPFVLASVKEVRPSAAEVLIEVDPSRRPSVRLRGRVVDENGEPLTDVEVSPFAFELGSSPVDHVDPRTGVFELGPYPSSEWGLVLVARDRPTLRVPPRRVSPDQLHDFGDLVMARGGVLAVAVVRESDVRGESVSVVLTPLDDQLVDGIRGEGALVRSHPLSVGRYLAQAFSSDGLSTEQPVEVHAGVETAVELRLRAAAPWSARIVDAEGRPWSGRVSWTASSGGETVAYGFESVVAGVLAPNMPLPAGELRLLVATPDGAKFARQSLSAELVTRAAEMPLEFEFR